MNVFWLTFLATLAVTITILLLFFVSYRFLFKKMAGRIIRLILTETYSKNIWELISSGMLRFKPQKIVEMALRAEEKEGIVRSLGSPKKMVGFEGLMFLPAQLAVMPTKEDYHIQTKTVIGPRAERPLQLEIPLLIGGMGAGTGVSERIKLAIAKGATAAGTATNTGDGPFLPEERKWADKLVVQYSQAGWIRDPQELEQADMIEIRVGSGASAGISYESPLQRMSEASRQWKGLQPGGPARIRSRIPGVDRPENWRELVANLREMTGGVPIGVKLVPSRVEEDIECALDADVDFITIDGAQAGIKESAPILQDDFGLPTLRGLVRTVKVLREKRALQRVSVIVSGGLYTPGDYLKAIALGADAVALGTTVLLAAIHTQITKVLPWEPLSQLAWAEGDFANRLDVEKAARNVANLLRSSVEEMKIAVTCLGKKAIHEVNQDDLVALDPFTARIAEVPLAYERSSGS
ncbi:FMN-binding glutamate synthase family protein [Polycladomyces sp. WAk]|uniref:FMN-binding glutamate synthase family protein n=1 Tax=Polycladomyces zharkentensis TaxID=2807616 RepID=A0ABS2WIT0_9BACL|nr:FMN-binding glutamate synthase family protein [Polycladomyces sp. WAk]MBN2909467.1 FMN-binding glutamate synthase family protein [Polycladomyces sp. WAk]